MDAIFRKKAPWIYTHGLTAGFILVLNLAAAQTIRTWNGSTSTDWYNPTNWIPTGVPAASDIINFTNGTIILSAPVTINGQFNWSGGTLNGDALTIATNGAMNLTGTSTLYLENALTNAGTVTWSNVSSLEVINGAGLYFGLIENLAGALFDIYSDASMYNSADGPAYFLNAGTLRKSASSGITSISIPLINAGSVTGLNGSLDLSGGGQLAGTFTAASGAAINFSGGNFSNSVPVTIGGPGSVQLTSGSLTLLMDIIPNLGLTGGTVNLGPAFQGGAITNLTINGSSLAGTNLVVGTFNWDSGTITGPLTVASNAVMNINGTSSLYLENALTNAGTVTWSNVYPLEVINGAGLYFGLIENLAGALFDIYNDASMYNSAPGPAYFHNAGTLRKSADSGITTISIPLVNSGIVTTLEGTLSFGNGGPLTGTFTTASGTSINFSGGNFSNSTPVTINGSGSVQLTSGNLTLFTDVISNLALTGGTLELGPLFQGGSITNLTLTGATLAGTNTVTGTFNWEGGTIAGGPLTVASNAVMNISAVGTLYLESALTNAGTVTWSNNCSLDVINGAGLYSGLIENLAGALFDIQSDGGSIYNGALGPACFHNAGTLQKSGHTATTYISIPVTNSGTITALHGNFDFVSSFTPAGGALFFGLSSPSSYGTMNISGNATLGGTAGVLWLNGFVPSSGNSFTVLTYGSYTDAFTNIILPTAAMWVTNYGPTSFTLSVATINQLAFTTQPIGGVLTNIVLAPVIVQVEDYLSNSIATNGVPITLSLSNRPGGLKGTLTQNTDLSGKATFGDLRVATVGTQVLRATSPGLVTAFSVPFQILRLVGLQWTNAGFLIQLNGTNTLGAVTIYASTNLLTWNPVFTNGPTNGSILFLDRSATNYRARFYQIQGP